MRATMRQPGAHRNRLVAIPPLLFETHSASLEVKRVVRGDSLVVGVTGIDCNPVRTGDDWRAMREAALDDPGAFHGAIAARQMHWFVADVGASGAWLARATTGDGPAGMPQRAIPVAPALSPNFIALGEPAFDATMRRTGAGSTARSPTRRSTRSIATCCRATATKPR